MQLDGRDLPAHHVGAARGNARGRHAAGGCLFDGGVKGVEPIHGPQLRGHRVGDLVVVDAFPAQSLFADADVGVRVDEPGQDVPGLRVEHLAVVGRGVLAVAEARDLSIFKIYITVFEPLPFHGEQDAVLNSHALSFSGRLAPALYPYILIRKRKVPQAVLQLCYRCVSIPRHILQGSLRLAIVRLRRIGS